VSYIFESAFAPYITGLIEQKHADGYTYTSGERLLKRLDAFCKENFSETDAITYDLAAEWSVIKPSESISYRNNRVATLRQLSLYMLSLGIDAYVPRVFSKRQKPVLYIPTREEMAAFFKEMGACVSTHPKYQRFIDECKIMFLLYYCCGMRLSEAQLLKKEYADLDNGVLTIFASKGHKDRLVYLPQDGIGVIAEYLRRIKEIVPDSPWMFPGENPSHPISHVAVENHFKKCWLKLPFATNANKHPTPHCLRHAFVVERLNDWMLRGIETQQMLAYLSKYLGHKSPSETFYYYHMVQEAFSVIKEKDKVSKRVIPEAIPYDD
jgi:integrase